MLTAFNLCQEASTLAFKDHCFTAGNIPELVFNTLSEALLKKCRSSPEQPCSHAAVMNNMDQD